MTRITLLWSKLQAHFFLTLCTLLYPKNKTFNFVSRMGPFTFVRGFPIPRLTPWFSNYLVPSRESIMTNLQKNCPKIYFSAFVRTREVSLNEYILYTPHAHLCEEPPTPLNQFDHDHFHSTFPSHCIPSKISFGTRTPLIIALFSFFCGGRDKHNKRKCLCSARFWRNLCFPEHPTTRNL